MAEGQMTYYKPRKYLPPEMYQSWGGLFMAKRYEILYKRTWVTAYRAEPVGQSLHYRLYDGSEGVAKPGDWRVRDQENNLLAMPYGVGKEKLKQYADEVRKPDFDTRDREGYDPEDDNILDI